MRAEVLGLPVDVLSGRETVEKIGIWLKQAKRHPKMVVTAYSEFFVTAQKDRDFAEIMKEADLVTPDGVSVLAAVRYQQRVQKTRNVLKCLAEGLKVGKEILTGEVGKTVTGVWLFEELAKEAEKQGWRVFLLGGWGEVSSKTARRLLERFPDLKVANDAGEERVGTDKAVDDRVVRKINTYKPDLLFVAYNPVKQEKWIASHRSRLKAGVAIGVGGTFNEYLGEFKKAPVWMGQAGLKWLWRVLVEPRRLRRILRAVLVFPWLVFRKSLR